MGPGGNILRWRMAILVSAAIAISYLDRQTLPVAVKAISRDIPLTNEQFSTLQSAFLFAYALMYARGREAGRCPQNAPWVHRDHAVLVHRVCEPCASHWFPDVGHQQIPSW